MNLVEQIKEQKDKVLAFKKENELATIDFGVTINIKNISLVDILELEKTVKDKGFYSDVTNKYLLQIFDRKNDIVICIWSSEVRNIDEITFKLLRDEKEYV